MAGIGLLPLLGVARTRRELVVRAGLGWLVGLAAGGILAALLALTGHVASWPQLAGFATLCLVAGGMRLRRAHERWRPSARPLALVTAALLLGLLVHAGLAFAVAPLVRFDSWWVWASKAKAIVDFGGAPASIFGDQRTVFLPHLEYPLLLPALEAVDFRTMGSLDVQTLHLQFLLFAPAAL